MIKKIKDTIKNFLLKETDIECAVDNQTVKCEDLEAPAVECGPGHLTQGYGWFGGRSEGYTGTVPAPRTLNEDPWFGPAPDTERSVELKQILISEQILEEEHYEEYTEKPVTIKEPENIHEVLYQMATENVATTLSLNPLPTFGGGSESYQEPWMSGVGSHF